MVPPHVEYTLTALGHEAAEYLCSVKDWIETNVTQLTARSADEESSERLDQPS